MNRLDESTYVLREPATAGPVVVSVPHAGERIPPEVAPTLAAPESVLRRDVDLHVDQLCARAPELGAALLASPISRFVIDLNRHPADVHAEAVQEPVRGTPSVSYGRRGLVWIETTRGEPVLAGPLTPEALEIRLAYYRPYHARLAALLAERRHRFGLAVLLDVHSMPACGAAGHCDAGRRRADIVLGDNLGQSCDAFLIDPIEAVFAQAGLSVARNAPYRGGYITQHYGRPRHGVQALQIEINRRLYLDEESLALEPTAASALQATLEQAIRTALAAVRL